MRHVSSLPSQKSLGQPTCATESPPLESLSSLEQVPWTSTGGSDKRLLRQVRGAALSHMPMQEN